MVHTWRATSMAGYLGLCVGRIVGVMKMTSSRFGSVVLDFDLKSQPRNGMSPKNGTFWMDSTTSCWRMPPIARVSPSLTTTCVVAERLLMLGTKPPPVCGTSVPREIGRASCRETAEVEVLQI